MTTIEFDVIDELYFVQSFSYLQAQLTQLSYDEQLLKDTLMQLLVKGWVKCFDAQSKEPIDLEPLAFKENYQNYHYLATKEGLLVHNSK